MPHICFSKLIIIGSDNGLSPDRHQAIIWTNAGILSIWPLGANQYICVIMSAMASQITSLTIVYSTVYSGADQRKHQSSASLAFVRGIHRWPVNSLHKGPVTRKMFPFDDVIMFSEISIEIPIFSFNKMHIKMSSGKWRSFCLGINMLICDELKLVPSDPFDKHYWFGAKPLWKTTII